MEQLNIEGKRSGEGFVAHREGLVGALSRAQAAKVEVIDTTLGRKGFLNYLRLLGGSNIVKIVPSTSSGQAPSNGSASGAQAAEKGLKVVCGSNISHLEDWAWVTERERYGDTCQVRVSPSNGVKPNLGSLELAEALSRVTPFAARGNDRPALACVRFAQRGGKLTLTAADGFRLAEVSLDLEDGEGEALIAARELRGLTSALKRAKRVRVSFETETSPTAVERNYLVIDTELIRYRWGGETGSYPDYEKVIPTEFEAEARFDAREMLKAAASLGALFLDRDAPIVLSLRGGGMRLWVKEGMGQAQVEAEAEGEGETAISARYLVQALKALGGMAEVKVKDSQSPILFAVDGYRLVVMPMALPARQEAVADAEVVEEEAAEAEAEPIAEVEPEASTEGEVEAEDKPSRKRKAREPVAAEV